MSEVAPVGVGGEGWRHDGRRMHLVGRGARLEQVRSGFVVMDAIEAGERNGKAWLHADRVEAGTPAAMLHRWHTALDLPLFAWDSAAGGNVAWTVGLDAGAEAVDAGGQRVTIRSVASGACALFETVGGRLTASGNPVRVRWASDGAARLIAIGAGDVTELERSLDLLGRRGIDGLARQRSQHAEQLHRGGTAISAVGQAGLADAFEWAKIRADAMLGAWLAGDRDAAPGYATPFLLGEALLAAGLPALPKALAKVAAGAESRVARERLAEQLAAWSGDDASDASVAWSESSPAEARGADMAPVDAIARGDAGAAEVASVLTAAVAGLWGVRPSAGTGAVALAPDLSALGAGAALSRLRVGRSVIDIRLRRRGDIVSLAMRRGAGPAIAVRFGARGEAVGEMLVDGEPIGGTIARFELDASRDIQLHLRSAPRLSSGSS